MRNLVLAATATAAILATSALTPARAILQIAADINSVTFFCADQQACDTNPIVGQLAIANTILGGVEFLGSAQTQVIGPLNSLNTSSFQIINDNATSVPVQVAVSGTNFTGPVATFNASGSGTWQSAVGSSVTETFFGDPANTQGANTSTDLPGQQLATLTSNAALPTDSFSQNFSGPFTAAGLYSMSLGTSGTLTAGGSLVGRSQTIITAQAIPEPATLALFGTALLGLGLVRRRMS